MEPKQEILKNIQAYVIRLDLADWALIAQDIEHLLYLLSKNSEKQNPKVLMELLMAINSEFRETLIQG